MQFMLREIGQAISIQPAADLDPATPVGELFVNGPISVVLVALEPGTGRFAVYGDRRFAIVPDETLRHSGDRRCMID